MLELTGGVGLRVDVGDLLELEGALQTHGVVDVAADEEDGGVVEVDGGEVLDILPVGENLLHLVGDALELLHNCRILLGSDGAHQVGEAQADEVDDRQLGGVGLGGSHGNLRSGPGVEHVVALPGDGGAHHVDDGQQSGPQPAGLPHGGQGVDGLAGLGDDQSQGSGGDDGVAVPELRGQGHLHRLAEQPLQGVLGGHAHVVGGAAGDDVDFVQRLQILRRQVQTLQHHTAVLNPGGNGVPEGLGLLHDLLEHEVLIAALLRSGDLPVHVVLLLVHRLEVGVVIDLDAVGGEYGNLPVVQIVDLTGVLDDGGHVAGQEVEALPQAQNQGAVLPGGDEPVGTVGADDAQGIGAVDAVEHLGQSLQNVAPVVVLQQLGHHLGVGLGDELHALGLEELLNLHVVLDDAVVDHRDVAALADLGVGVDVGGCSVGGPAGVAQAHGAVDGRAAVHHVGEHLEPALGLGHLEPLAFRPHGDARRVIAPVLQTAQAVQQNGRRLFSSNISYNTAHGRSPPVTWMFRPVCSICFIL
ncbi:Uncharacterised protein [uncultured Flavonifractor sp.]|nr:Uncharacterised protein [uncultured Flavonifractor sp.]